MYDLIRYSVFLYQKIIRQSYTVCHNRTVISVMHEENSSDNNSNVRDPISKHRLLKSGAKLIQPCCPNLQRHGMAINHFGLSLDEVCAGGQGG